MKIQTKGNYEVICRARCIFIACLLFLWFFAWLNGGPNSKITTQLGFCLSLIHIYISKNLEYLNLGALLNLVCYFTAEAIDSTI